MGIPTFLPGRFPGGISHPGQFPHTLLPDISPNSLPGKFPPNTFPVALDDVPFAVGLAQTQFSQKTDEIFCHPKLEICRARSLRHWQQRCLTHSEECQWPSAGLDMTTVIAHHLANCVYFCLCWVVEEYNLSLTFCGSLFRHLWRDIAYRDVPLQNRPTIDNIAQK